MQSYFSYSLIDLKLGRNIKQHIEKYKSFLNGTILVKPVGINIGLIEELKNQGYKIIS